MCNKKLTLVTFNHYFFTTDSQVLHSLYENRLVLQAWSAGVLECMTKLHAQTSSFVSRIGPKAWATDLDCRPKSSLTLQAMTARTLN